MKLHTFQYPLIRFIGNRATAIHLQSLPVVLRGSNTLEWLRQHCVVQTISHLKLYQKRPQMQNALGKMALTM